MLDFQQMSVKLPASLWEYVKQVAGREYVSELDVIGGRMRATMLLQNAVVIRRQHECDPHSAVCDRAGRVEPLLAMYAVEVGSMSRYHPIIQPAASTAPRAQAHVGHIRHCDLFHRKDATIVIANPID